MILAQIAPPEFHFNAMTWAAFVLANAIIIGIIAPKLVRELRGRS